MAEPTWAARAPGRVSVGEELGVLVVGLEGVVEGELMH
jgi:hypothetical protein